VNREMILINQAPFRKLGRDAQAAREDVFSGFSPFRMRIILL
jgi:hypothetical protein